MRGSICRLDSQWACDCALSNFCCGSTRADRKARVEIQPHVLNTAGRLGRICCVCARARVQNAYAEPDRRASPRLFRPVPTRRNGSELSGTDSQLAPASGMLAWIPTQRIDASSQPERLSETPRSARGRSQTTQATGPGTRSQDITERPRRSVCPGVTEAGSDTGHSALQ
jgi:hypothetical protein